MVASRSYKQKTDNFAKGYTSCALYLHTGIQYKIPHMEKLDSTLVHLPVSAF